MGGHPAGDPVHGGGRRGVEGPGAPGGQGQSAAVPEGGGGSELPAQVDQAIRKKEELHKALREHRELTPEEALVRRRHKELVTDEMHPGASPGGNAGPAVSEGAGPSGRSTWSDSRPSRVTSTWRGRALTPARHWLGDGLPPGSAGGEQAHPGHQPGMDAEPHPQAG